VKPGDADSADALLSPWTAYARRMYKNHLMNGKFTGAAVSNGSVQVNLANLTELYAETDYTVWVYVYD